MTPFTDAVRFIDGDQRAIQLVQNGAKARKLQPLGRRETGSRAALPMWIEFMRSALEGVDEQILDQPEGLGTVRIYDLRERVEGRAPKVTRP